MLLVFFYISKAGTDRKSRIQSVCIRYNAECRVWNVKCGIENAEWSWSKCQTTWPLSFRILPHTAMTLLDITTSTQIKCRPVIWKMRMARARQDVWSHRSHLMSPNEPNAVKLDVDVPFSFSTFLVIVVDQAHTSYLGYSINMSCTIKMNLCYVVI